MINSILNNSEPSRYVYFNNDGMITKISSKKENDTDVMWATFKTEDVIPFIDGTYRFSDYVVNKNAKNLGHSIIKKRVDLKSRAIESQIKKITYCNDADIVVLLQDDTIKITASSSIVDKDISPDQEVMIAGKADHPFFVTLKDKPDYILKEILVPYSLILTGSEFSDVIPFSSKKVSVYTRPYFNTYSLEI